MPHRRLTFSILDLGKIDQYSVLVDTSFWALEVGLGAQSGTTAPEPVEMGQASDPDAFWRTPCVGIQLGGDLEGDLEHTDQECLRIPPKNLGERHVWIIVISLLSPQPARYILSLTQVSDDGAKGLHQHLVRIAGFLQVDSVEIHEIDFNVHVCLLASS